MARAHDVEGGNAMGHALVTDPAKCTGCLQCELACSLKHEGQFAPWLARVVVHREPETCLAFPNVCRHCDDPPCVRACPVEALKTSPGTGAVYVDVVECIGCRECLEACSYGSISFDPDKGVALKCDLCNGEPACVQVCPNGAIRLERCGCAAPEGDRLARPGNPGRRRADDE
ncbi:MAG: 4Fe-4S dicluster domain-containing protein [Clostridia bacterium]